ncbi:unnamed protein product [Caenorhabditis angaria]|uniref:Uncharacterized protein n=1 Tax=Caenorhabditis angaria TaxID=860376 RepID=A0A9P1IAI3_9PELO|nr:unnamed protein product [Caenorhabditis angaria]
MPKFVVVELTDDMSTIDLLSFCVKRNLERVSLLQRLEDHPYLRDESELSQQQQPTRNGGAVNNLSDDEKNRLLKIISGGGHQQHQQQQHHHLVQHPMPSTSSFGNQQQQSTFMYLKTESQQQQQQQQEQQQYGMKNDSHSFEQTVNQVAHGQLDDMQNLEVIRELFPTGDLSSPGEVLRRKAPVRRPEESCKATCKICGHDVMYSPQRTWNLMRHVWIMHQSSKPSQCSICGYSHIKPYVRKHIETQHKQQNATIIDLKSPELEAEWASLLDQCFGVTYRKWKHIKEDPQPQQQQHVVVQNDDDSFGQDHFQNDVMTNL